MEFRHGIGAIAGGTPGEDIRSCEVHSCAGPSCSGKFRPGKFRPGKFRPGAPLSRLFHICLLVSALLLPAAAAALEQPAGEARQEAVRAVAIDISGNREKSRIMLTLSAPVEARTFLLERPDRLIIDLPQVAFSLSADSHAGARKGVAGGLVASYRYGLFAQGRSRVVVDLKEPALVSKVTSEPVANGAMLTVELSRTDRAAYGRAAMQPMVEAAAALSAAENARAAAARASAQAADRQDSRPLVMIDPGHGGVDPGAIRKGIQEKDLVLSFARRLQEKLGAGGRYRVQLTRGDDSFISLAGRVRIAREAGADLFISVHADSLGGNGSVRGATVYTSSNTPTDEESAQLAAKENLADQIAGLEAAEETGDVVGILAELTRRETQALSHVFAERTIETLRAQVHLNRNPHRSAGFRVLKAPDVPSVLLELGYLSSEQDVALLTSDAWQEKTVRALVAAIDRFFARRIAEQGRDKG
ncbi:MAG: N-acetylmuramoyl-L-alanine amidase [Pseudochelatococcus sp.]|uniref:N-acetylmuramoyl-L-alanine amidase n=1 Tax=Pseudochelatococcus sp. TaxID=2020869 RepID=UPI003D92D8E9